MLGRSLLLVHRPDGRGRPQRGYEARRQRLERDRRRLRTRALRWFLFALLLLAASAFMPTP